MAARSKAFVCGRSPAEIVGSNPTGVGGGAWVFVCCECCVLSDRGLCDELITRPEVSYRLWCVVVCDLETSRMRRSWPALGRSATKKKLIVTGFNEQRFLVSTPHCGKVAHDIIKSDEYCRDVRILCVRGMFHKYGSLGHKVKWEAIKTFDVASLFPCSTVNS